MFDVPVSRRTLLAGMGAAAGGVALASCAVKSTIESAPSSAAPKTFPRW